MAFNLAGVLAELGDIWRGERGEETMRARKEREVKLTNENQAALDRRLLAQAQIAKMQEELGAAPDIRSQRTKLVEAQIRNLDEPNRVGPAPKTPEELAFLDARTKSANATAALADARRSVVGTGGPARRPGKPYPAVVDGKVVMVDPDSRQPIPGMLPPPTAEQKNQEFQAAAVEPAFDLVESSLGQLEGLAGGLAGKAAGMIPGTDAYFAKNRFIDQAKALLGAIVARQAGEGSRLSDEDRKAYSQAATLVNNQLLLPGGIAEARSRIADARKLLLEVENRRKQQVLGASAGVAPQSSQPAKPRPAPPQTVGGYLIEEEDPEDEE